MAQNNSNWQGLSVYVLGGGGTLNQGSVARYVLGLPKGYNIG